MYSEEITALAALDTVVIHIVVVDPCVGGHGSYICLRRLGGILILLEEVVPIAFVFHPAGLRYPVIVQIVELGALAGPPGYGLSVGILTAPYMLILIISPCAGLILLASGIEEQEDVCFGTMPVRVRRNAYGRQLGSFHTLGTVEGIGDVEMTFIRAPVVTECGSGVEILSRVRDDIVAVRYKRQYALSFHPELESTADAEWIYRRVFFSHS